ncbi:MAG: CpaD family pilus assembly protein [Caulobacter sp.]|nr:CpaD family pilus assembly protein [Caulobacter sp.]
MTSFFIRLTPLTAALLLAACASAPVNTAGPVPATALDAWSSRVEVISQPDEIRLAPHLNGLSGTQARALTEFHARWVMAEGGLITIASPSGGSGENAYRVGVGARAFLLSQGAAPDKVRLIGYDAAGAPDAPVVVGFQRYVAVTPRCGGWEAVTRSADNRPYANLGCAVSANMAAQVANPEDLLRARTMDPADTGRRTTVLDKYRKGEVTSTAKDDQASGAVSTAVQ